MNFIKKYFLWIILIFCLGWYFVVLAQKPCDSPIKYRISTFDSRFNISQKTFQSDIDSAIAIWEKPLGKKLFVYDPKAKLTINLIYDIRQINTQQNALLETDINKTNGLALTTKQQYLSLKSQYFALEQQYTSLLNKFNSDQSSYNAQVEHWNSLGGAPSTEYDKLNAIKDSLIVEQNTLESKRVEVNNLANSVNQFIQKYNLLVENANSIVDKVNQNASLEFDEGIYSPSNNEIDIYQFTDNQKLIRVLAHELGHALGLGHNNNPQSIMYSVNQSTNLVLSADDLSAVKTVCKLK